MSVTTGAWTWCSAMADQAENACTCSSILEDSLWFCKPWPRCWLESFSQYSVFTYKVIYIYMQMSTTNLRHIKSWIGAWPVNFTAVGTIMHIVMKIRWVPLRVLRKWYTTGCWSYAVWCDIYYGWQPTLAIEQLMKKFGWMMIEWDWKQPIFWRSIIVQY